MDINDILRRIDDRSAPPPSPAEILEILGKYPYFSALAVAWLKRTAEENMLYDSETRREIARRAFLADPAAGDDVHFMISDLAAGDKTDDNFYPQQQKEDTPGTEKAIDIFLDNYAAGTDNDRESAIIEQLIFNPVADYAAVLAAEEQQSKPHKDSAEPGSDDDLINRFILGESEKNAGNTTEQNPRDTSVETPKVIADGTEVKKPVPRHEETMLSESLAKMYIVRKNYTAAYEIINRLNLNYPEKSIYFAVQLRFLKKLILNEELKSMEKNHANNS